MSAATHLSKFRRARGFTLIELMIVITIIMILATIAAARYTQSVQRSKEAVLKTDLKLMREAIQSYTLDKNAAPQSLDDLVSNEDSKYLGDIPIDPITRAKDWSTETCDLRLSPEQTTTGVCDVHSSSPATSPFENTPYSTW